MERGIEDGVCESSGKGLQSIEKTGFVQVLLFCLGTLPQAVKLMALSGIFWTQVWAGLYLSSFLTIQFLVLMAEGQGEHAETLTKSHDIAGFKQMSTLKKVLGICSIFIHLLLGIWAYHEILFESTNTSGIENPEKYSFMSPSFWGAIFMVSESATLLIIPRDLLLANPLDYGHLDLKKLWTFLFYPGIVSCITCCVTLVLMPNMSMKEDLSNYLLYSISFSLIWMFILCLSSYSEYIQGHVLFLDPQSLYRGPRASDYFAKDLEARFNINLGVFIRSFYAWVFFLSTFVLSVAWYKTCYNPTGTLKPEWVDVLG